LNTFYLDPYGMWWAGQLLIRFGVFFTVDRSSGFVLANTLLEFGDALTE